MFRNFGSKAELFEAAILKLFADFVNSWAATWNSRTADSSDAEEITHTFVKGFYAVAVEHRELLHTLVAARVKGGDPALADVATRVSGDLAEGLRVTVCADYCLNTVAHSTCVMSTRRCLLRLPPVRSSHWFSSTTGCSPSERRPGKARQFNELTQMLLYGASRQ